MPFLYFDVEVPTQGPLGLQLKKLNRGARTAAQGGTRAPSAMPHSPPAPRAPRPGPRPGLRASSTEASRR